MRVGVRPNLVTILFTDLVGSTALRSRLGEGAADDLRRLHDALLAGAVEGHGGWVVHGRGVPGDSDVALARLDHAADLAETIGIAGVWRDIVALRGRVGV